MTRTVSTSIENNFRAGLVTEVTGVNSPENSVTATLNVAYDRKGRAVTRKGFALEDTPAATVNTRGAKNEFVWETLADNSNKTFVVVQLGTTIRFMSSVGGDDLLAGYEDFFVNLVDYKVAGFTNAQVRDESVSFAAGKGYLFVAHPLCNTIYIKYNKNNTIDVSRVTIKIRDFEATEDGLPIQNRPTTLTVKHNYNLLNQGWYSKTKGGSTSTIYNVLEYWDLTRDDFPSDADAWWYYMSVQDPDQFYPDEFAESRGDLYGNTPAAKGHYIITALESNREALSGVTGVPEVSSDGYRPSVVAFFSGRVFYAGVGHPDYSSSLYFSQIIQEDADLGKCYQINDPTSKEAFDLLPSDGGTVKIQDINKVIDIKVIGASLYIFASNGIWSITGSNDGPFKATDYFISKVSSFPALTKTSIVDVGGLPVWFNYEGIFAIQKDQVGASGVVNVSEQTIQTFYDQIPQVSKENAKGYFNDQEGIVYWIYSSTPSDNYLYTNVLVFDVVAKSFYIYDIPQDYYQIFGLVAVRADVDQELIGDVVEDGEYVVIDGEQVTINVGSDLSVSKKVFKFLCQLGTTSLSVADLSDLTYLDWGEFPYETYFITGYRIRGELLKEFQTNYLSVITESDPGSSCYVQGIWNYTNSPDSGKYTNPQQAIRARPDKTYQRVRLKMRGQGYALQFKFYGEAGRPFTIIGWSGFETGNSNP